MNILITGAGLIGSNARAKRSTPATRSCFSIFRPTAITSGKSSAKTKPTSVAADMRDLPALLSALEKYNVDTLVHTAGLIGWARAREFLYRRDQ